MLNNDTLSPVEAAYIANNVYFTLSGWINEKPTAGVESASIVQNRVLGRGDQGMVAPGTDPKLKLPAYQTSLQGTPLGRGKLGNDLLTGTTGFGVSTGFGYTLTYESKGRTHLVIATRGTRPELGGPIGPDLLTDLRGAMTPVSGFGPVHKGFKTTYDSVATTLSRPDVQATIKRAHVVHCVGHSLGGAIATLIAARLASDGKNVRLYTFGSPRVGAMFTYRRFEQAIRPENIFRVAHDLDPVTLIGPYPYIHVVPNDSYANFMTIPSPFGSLFSTANHSMAAYIKDVTASQALQTGWSPIIALSGQVDHDNAVLARWLLHSDNNPGWVSYASAQTLGILFKLFKHVLANMSTALILNLSAIDLLAEVLMTGMYRMTQLGAQVLQLMRYAATWAGIQIAAGAEFTAAIIRLILGKMLAAIRQMTVDALNNPARYLRPLPIMLAGAALIGHSAF